MVRAYGIPVKSITSLLPLFSTEVQVLGEEPNSEGWTFPDTTGDNFTHYQVVDPAGNRNFCAIWAAVNEEGDVYIEKEFPERSQYGEWALFGEKGGMDPHPKIGYDVQGYCALFDEIEEELGIEVFERIGDSRYFALRKRNNLDSLLLFLSMVTTLSPQMEGKRLLVYKHLMNGFLTILTMSWIPQTSQGASYMSPAKT